MSLFSLLGAVEIGLIFSLVALGVYISFRLLRFPDLTVDGSYTTGAAVTAILIVNGVPFYLAIPLAIVSGMLAGVITGLLHVWGGINPLLAGILTQIALYSINLRIMGAPNVPLIGSPTVFAPLIDADGANAWLMQPALLATVVVVAKLALDAFFASQAGLSMRATGANARMARAQGISTDRMTLLGMALSNALIAVAGALYVQTQGGADVSMGIGTIVVGLAAVIIGETLLPAGSLWLITLGTVLGALLYHLLIALALNADFLGLQAQDLNLVTALLVGLALVLPRLKRSLRSGKRTAS